MRKIREMMRLKYALGRSHRETAASLGIANSTVSDYAGRAREAGLGWPLPEGLDDAALEAALFPPAPPSSPPSRAGLEPNARELRRHKGVTLRLLWLEYRTAHPDGYGYSRLYDRCRLWRLDVVLRQVYRAGEKAFVDYAGPKFAVVDGRTGEARDAVVFVGVPTASNYAFVDVTRSRSLPGWTASHVRMFEFFGGVPELVIPDNETAGVRAASRHEPDLNRPTGNSPPTSGRPCSPRAWGSPGTRRRSRPPSSTSSARSWRRARVNIDYHVQVGGRFYSVPRALARREVDVRGRCRRGRDLPPAPTRGGLPPRPSQGRPTRLTRPHMPAAHRAHAEWSPSRLIARGRKVGPDTAAFVRRLLESRPHPEQGYRSCLGLMRLARAYPAERMEAPCRRALDIGALGYGSV